MRRQFPIRPILCVGGVVIEDGKVVLVRRGHEPQKGQWSIPGGAVELGEKIVSAVRREVHEETKLFVEPVELISVFERIVRNHGRVRYHYVVLDYACRLKKGRIAPESDVLDARWVSRCHLDGYRLLQPTENVIQQAFDYFQKLR
jgi:8-oxo-dGTP diphosphatase